MKLLHVCISYIFFVFGNHFLLIDVGNQKIWRKITEISQITDKFHIIAKIWILPFNWENLHCYVFCNYLKCISTIYHIHVYYTSTHYWKLRVVCRRIKNIPILNSYFPVLILFLLIFYPLLDPDRIVVFIVHRRINMVMLHCHMYG